VGVPEIAMIAPPERTQTSNAHTEQNRIAKIIPVVPVKNFMNVDIGYVPIWLFMKLITAKMIVMMHKRQINIAPARITSFPALSSQTFSNIFHTASHINER
jgi:hypothetical protein